MLWRTSSGSRGRPRSAPPGFIHPARPTVSKRPQIGDGWVHEVKHDGYRMQIHVRDGRCRLYTMNAANWTERYPLVTAAAARLKVTAIIDAEPVCTDADGIAQFDMLHARCHDHQAIACAFDLLMRDGDDLRRRPLADRKAALRKLLTRRSADGLQYVEHVAGDGAEMFAVACAHGLEGIVSKRLTAPYKSGPVKSWIKVKNPAAPAYLRVSDGTF